MWKRVSIFHFFTFSNLNIKPLTSSNFWQSKSKTRGHMKGLKLRCFGKLNSTYDGKLWRRSMYFGGCRSRWAAAVDTLVYCGDIYSCYGCSRRAAVDEGEKKYLVYCGSSTAAIVAIYRIDSNIIQSHFASQWRSLLNHLFLIHP